MGACSRFGWTEASTNSSLLCILGDGTKTWYEKTLVDDMKT